MAGELEATAAVPVADIMAPDLRVLFCGINPGLVSAATGRHFARPGNRFWKVLHGAGFTDRVLRPDEQAELLDRGIGITNLVDRATAAAAELDVSELQAGARRLAARAAALAPAHVAVLGLGAYRTGFGRRQAGPGRQPETLGPAVLWALPNPSGLQAHYQLPELIEIFGELARAAFAGAPPGERSRRAGGVGQLKG
jgi:double-stranded uracil-DNA glycosylase